MSAGEESRSRGAANGSVDSHERGRRAREVAPRSSHGAWEPAADRPDPVALLEQQAADRVEELVPIRYGRMLASPFAFYRGAAAVMAADLAETPCAGITVQACGDAHLANFGGFAAPDRRLIFDINDFDETLPGPWEWDVKRLVASLEVATRDREFGRKQRVLTVKSAAMEYREQMRRLAAMGNLEAWYERVDLELLRDQFASEVDEESVAMFDKNLAKAKRKTSERAFAKLAREVDGKTRISQRPAVDHSAEGVARPFFIRRRNQMRSGGCMGSTGQRFLRTFASSSIATGSSTSPARWSALAASGPAPG